MSKDEYIQELVRKSIESSEDESVPLSQTIQKCIRIARLRNDFINLWWLHWETIDIAEEKLFIKIIEEIFSHLTKETYNKYQEMYRYAWVEEREFTLASGSKSEKKVMNKGVQEIELYIEHLETVAEGAHPPDGLHPVDLYFENQSATGVKHYALRLVREHKSILSRIRTRVHDFLSQTEKQVIFGQYLSAIFEKNIAYVDQKLSQICPDAQAKFASAYNRLNETNPESWAQSLTTCRRLLKSLADVLYPVPKDPVPGIDGKSHKLTDDKYIARLWQFIFEKLRSSTSGELLIANIQELGNRLDRLYNLTCKGPHADVNEFEVNQCFIQTYLLAGDILRIADDSSAILYSSNTGETV